MRAVRYERFGGPEVLEEVELPAPVAGVGETLVEVEAAGVNFGDIKQIAGELTDGPYAMKGPCRTPLAWRSSAGQRTVAGSSDTSGREATPQRRGLRPRLGPCAAGCERGAALALLVQGLTAWHLLRSVARPRPGEHHGRWVLAHFAHHPKRCRR